MRCAFCQNGDIRIDKDNGEIAEARALAAMAWLLCMEGCRNVNWMGGEVAVHLHAIVEAIALLGNGSAPTRAGCRRGRLDEGRTFLLLRHQCRCRESRRRLQRAHAVEQQLLHDARGHEDPAPAD